MIPKLKAVAAWIASAIVVVIVVAYMAVTFLWCEFFASSQVFWQRCMS